MNKLILPLIASLFLVLGSCSSDDYTVSVHFHNPEDGAVITMEEAKAFEIDIDFSAEDELHEVEILVHAEGQEDDPIIDFDNHLHENEFVFEQEVDLSSFESGTKFHIEATVCADHECATTEEHSISFSIE